MVWTSGLLVCEGGVWRSRPSELYGRHGAVMAASHGDAFVPMLALWADVRDDCYCLGSCILIVKETKIVVCRSK